ncbi:MAG TPA: sensor domain-containing protein [Thermoanaerobaculia bacterium]|nr:sensor domain-containing protein [Thermoanaerobaculia bacterium]
MHAATLDLHSPPAAPARTPFAAALVGFLRAPIEPRTWGNLLYLLLAFPFGLAYFVVLTVAFSLSVGLLILWIGLLVLALTFAAAWACAALERLLAIGLLGAQIPATAPRTTATDRKLLQRARDYLADPVTWTGLLFLFLKFPLGLATFVLWVTLIALSGSLVAAPFLYSDWPPQIVLWEIDTLPEALACGAAGLLLLLVTLNLLNGVAAGWRWLAEAMLGSRRFRQEPA